MTKEGKNEGGGGGGAEIEELHILIRYRNKNLNSHQYKFRIIYYDIFDISHYAGFRSDHNAINWLFGLDTPRSTFEIEPSVPYFFSRGFL